MRCHSTSVPLCCGACSVQGLLPLYLTWIAYSASASPLLDKAHPAQGMLEDRPELLRRFAPLRLEFQHLRLEQRVLDAPAAAHHALNFSPHVSHDFRKWK